MKHALRLLVLALSIVTPQFGSAQALKGGGDYLELGVFADYFRMDRTSPTLNYVGLGGRAALHLSPRAQIEAEMAYDFDRTYNNPFSNGEVVRSETHVLQGLFGPKLQTGSGAFRLFVTGKAGFISFTTNTQNPPTGFQSALGAVGNGNTEFAVYPGGGVEGFIGPLGVRLEIGDDIYFDNGARNNLRISFGPSFRF